MKTLYAHQTKTILDNLNAASEQLAILMASLSASTPECTAAIRAEVRVKYARDVLMHAVIADAPAQPVAELEDAA